MFGFGGGGDEVEAEEFVGGAGAAEEELSRA